MTLLATKTPAGDSLAFITLFGRNRDPRVIEWHRKVMVDHLGLPVNYVEAPFPGVSHGACMNHILRGLEGDTSAPAFIWWLDNDALLLTTRAFTHACSITADHHTLWGQAWNSSHKVKPRGGNHPYASQACMLLSMDLYRWLGAPDCDHHNARSDTAEELTYAAEEQGRTVALQWPSMSDTYTTEVGQLSSYGRGNIYGPNLTYHESRADLPDHADRFVAMCQRVIGGEFGG